MCTSLGDLYFYREPLELVIFNEKIFFLCHCDQNNCIFTKVTIIFLLINLPIIFIFLCLRLVDCRPAALHDKMVRRPVIQLWFPSYIMSVTTNTKSFSLRFEILISLFFHVREDSIIAKTDLFLCGNFLPLLFVL